VASQEILRVPASFQAIGDASVSFQSPLSIFSNSAGFASEKHPSFGIQYENRFLLKELRTTSGFLILPVHQTNFGFAYSQFGEGSYRESMFSLGTAKRLSERLTAGIQLHYYSVFLSENREHVGTLLADFGVQYQFKNGFRAGLQLFNPYSLQPRNLYLELDHPTVLRIGIQKLVEESLIIAFECRKEFNRPIAIKSGIEFKIRDQVQLRLGIDARSAVFALGLGYSLKNFQTDLAFSYHQYLGYSPAFSIYYRLP
jgi:hypothetical protein